MVRHQKESGRLLLQAQKKSLCIFEFAADLWQVHLDEGTDEYKNPVEFFRRTYLTESLKSMLVGAVRRLSGQGADPVVQLQTNFGGGKTHSMLALYHLFSGIAPMGTSGHHQSA
jgi:predicted AAA+ superfamily ATPase